MQISASQSDSQSILAIARQSALKKETKDQCDGQITGGGGVATGAINSLNASASAFQSMLSASALDNATGTQLKYSGANLAAVTATNDQAKASGLSGGFDLSEILTDKDKAITGYDPNDPNPNLAAIIIGSSRYSGQLTGDITSNFLSTLQTFNDVSDAFVQKLQYNLAQYEKYGNAAQPWR